MSRANKKEPESEVEVEKTESEIKDEISRMRKSSPHYQEGFRAFNEGENVTILPELEEGALPLEWLYGYIDSMAAAVRNVR